MPKITCNEGLVLNSFQRFKICFENGILDILFNSLLLSKVYAAQKQQLPKMWKILISLDLHAALLIQIRLTKII